MSNYSLLLVFLFCIHFIYAASYTTTTNISISLTHYIIDSSVKLDGFPVGLQASLATGSFYFVRLGVGTLPRFFTFVMDTGSDITWIQHDSCDPCIYQEDQPLFGHADHPSSSYVTIKYHEAKCSLIFPPEGIFDNCPYQVFYGGSAGSSAGDVVTETLAVGDGSFRDHVMGSGTFNTGNHGGAAGLFALNQAPSSFLKQMGITFFSYCLHAADSTELRGLEFGGTIPNDAKKFDLIAPPAGDFAYYIPVQGISVDGEKLEIDPAKFKLDYDSLNGGIMLDTGTHLTHLSSDIYVKLYNAFRDQIRKNIPTFIERELEHGQCYDIASNDIPKVPPVHFHLGEGENEFSWPIPLNGVLYHVDKDRYCFSFKTVESTFDPMMIGNLAQQNTKLYFDLKNQKFGVSLWAC